MAICKLGKKSQIGSFTAQKRTSTPDTLVSDLISELWGNKLLLFKAPDLWCFCYGSPRRLTVWQNHELLLFGLSDLNQAANRLSCSCSFKLFLPSVRL